MYATYRRVATFSDVPPAGPLNLTAREHHRLDFKENASPTTIWEHAKDIAALANTFGGVILIGARAKGGTLEHKGIPSAFASELKEVYEQAAQDHCSPPAIVDAIPIPIPTLPGDLVLLAVNVEPVIEGPIGAKAERKDRKGATIANANAWVFPVREASQTKYLTPNELPMHMTPKVRRTILLLDCIPESTTVQLWLQPNGETAPGSRFATHIPGPLSLQLQEAAKGAVDLARNSFICVLDEPRHRNGRLAVGVPLTDVEDIWRAPDGKWNIRLGGRINIRPHPSGPWEVTYCPVVR
ncbi:ATP-binding protein [Sorangium sp. So ce269]